MLLPLFLTGCNNANNATPPSEEKIQYINVEVNEITLHEEDTFQIEVEIIKRGTIVFFSSNNDSVASVDQKGLVTANKTGETSITVRGGKDTFSVYVIVLPYEADNSLQIILTKDSFVLEKEDEFVLPLEVKLGKETIIEAILSYQYEVQDIVSITDKTVLAKNIGSTEVIVTASYLQEEVSKRFNITVY